MGSKKFMLRIKKQKESEDSWQFRIEVREDGSETTHLVTMDKDYFAKFSDRFSSSEELVKKSFEFLLERESKESILGEFNISVIKNYFPDYEQEI